MYVGSDGKIHFTNRAGADSALPFSSQFSNKIIAAAYLYYVAGSGAGGTFDTVTGENIYDYFGINKENGTLTVKAGVTALVVVNNYPDDPGKLSVFDKTHDVETYYTCYNTNRWDNFIIAIAYEK